ncbi:MAG: hypothetical protein MJK18_03970 [Bdellovibrionales bacterium]|nr:hypothetical protein [Bdellovibrionales bacterium]
MGLREKTKQDSIKVLAQKADPISTESNFELPTRYEQDHGVELDLIERLKSNIAMLDDLQQRLGFMNDELENVIGSRIK